MFGPVNLTVDYIKQMVMLSYGVGKLVICLKFNDKGPNGRKTPPVCQDRSPRMPFLQPGTAERVFFPECVQCAMPRTEPGREAARTMKPFLPGMERELEKFLERTSAMIAHLENRPCALLHHHLDNLNRLSFLETDPLSWGVVDLGRIHVIVSSLAWMEDHFAGISCFRRFSGHARQLLRLLSPHCERGGFFLKAATGSALEQARGELDAAQREFLEFEARQRTETANELGLAPSRLKSDVTVPQEDGKSLHLFRSSARMKEISRNGRQIQFRFLPDDTAPQAVRFRNRTLACRQLEEEGVREICRQIPPHLDGLRTDLLLAGELDLHVGRGRFAMENRAVCPGFHPDQGMAVHRGRHPELERQVRELNREYQDLSFSLSGKIISLTGANMGGKTAFLRTVGLFQMLFQWGYFIPADQFSGVLVHAVAWVGAVPDAPNLGLSSFGRECRELVDALALPNPMMMLVDEFARSTDADEGRAFQGALFAFLASEKTGLFLFAGHQKNLDTQGIGVQSLRTGGLDPDRCRNAGGTLDSVEKLATSMDYRIHEGTSEHSDALEIAQALGVPVRIIQTAKELLEKSTVNSGDPLDL